MRRLLHPNRELRVRGPARATALQPTVRRRHLDQMMRWEFLRLKSVLRPARFPRLQQPHRLQLRHSPERLVLVPQPLAALLCPTPAPRRDRLWDPKHRAPQATELRRLPGRQRAASQAQEREPLRRAEELLLLPARPRRHRRRRRWGWSPRTLFLTEECSSQRGQQPRAGQLCWPGCQRRAAGVLSARRPAPPETSFPQRERRHLLAGPKESKPMM
jgi:hypothetical protein